MSSLLHVEATGLDARETTLELLRARAPGATICPSEVARTLVSTGTERGTQDWRRAMPAVHAAIDELRDEGRVQLSWKGRPLAARAGPYRIASAHPGDEPAA